MKVKSVPALFEPVEIILETPEEVAKFYAIMNYMPLLNSLKIDNIVEADPIRKKLDKFCSVFEQDKWFDAISKSYQQLKKSLLR